MTGVMVEMRCRLGEPFPDNPDFVHRGPHPSGHAVFEVLNSWQVAAWHPEDDGEHTESGRCELCDFRVKQYFSEVRHGPVRR